MKSTLPGEARTLANNLRNCNARFNVYPTKDTIHAAAMLDECADELQSAEAAFCILRTENERINAMVNALMRAPTAPTLSHRTVCIVACQSMIADMRINRERLDSELQTRTHVSEAQIRDTLRERIASLDRDIDGMRAAIAWLDRVTGVY